MSSIAAASLSQSFSPLQRLQSELASEVSSGAISSDDQSALSSALNDIDSSLKVQAPNRGSQSSPGDIQSKVDDLIAKEVSDGKLTSAQADELKSVFAQSFQGGPGGSGPGGPGGAGGGGGSCGSSQSSTDAADTNGDGVVSAAEQAAYDAQHPGEASGSDSSSSDTSKLLSDFLKLLQDSQGSSSSYGSNGDNLISQIQSLIVNYQA
jgi:hypothetical protein